MQKQTTKENIVWGPEGSPLTLENLPPVGTKRWVVRRKAEVVLAVQAGLLSLAQACERYNLSVEEFLSWQGAITHYGVEGLHITWVQNYR